LKIDYPNDKDVVLGNTLTPQEASERPSVFFVAPEQDEHYTLVLVSFRQQAWLFQHTKNKYA
jgi:hypothetical protein